MRLAFTVAAALAIAVIAALAHRVFSTAVVEWQERLGARCEEQAEAVAAWAERIRTEATLIADFPTVQSLVGVDVPGAAPYPVDAGPARHLATILGPLVRRPEFRALTVTDGGGEVVFQTGRTAVPGPAGRPLGDLREGIEMHALDPGHAVVVGRAPIRGEARRPVGAVRVAVDPGVWLFPFLSRRLPETRTGESYLVSRDGDRAVPISPLRHPTPEAGPTGAAAGPVPASSDIDRPAGTVGRYVDYRGVEVYSALEAVPGTGWRLLTEIDRSEVRAAAAREAGATVGLALAAVAVLGLAGTMTRSARERQHRRELERLEAHYRRIVESAQEGVMVLDADGRITYANRRLAEIVDRAGEELIGRRVVDLVDETARDGARRRLERRLAGERETYEITFELPGHGRRVVLVNASPLTDDLGAVTGVLAMLTDVTELRSVEDQLRQAQRLEAVGRLAGGVAHDFNNLLQAMLGTAQLVRMRVADDPSAAERVDELVAHVIRGADVTRQLLLFSRRDSTARVEIDLTVLLGRLESLLRRLLPENVAVRMRIGEAPLPVLAEPIQLEQVVMNLAVNAADAMPDGGTLTVDAGREGDAVVMRVTDTGGGVPPELRDRIFEAFFTTKERGVGTGLGLSVVARIVRDHGGEIELEASSPGEGTTFRVSLPAAAGLGGGPAEGLGDAVVELPRGGGERVLVVEDEAATREGLGILLEELGYLVDLAETGAEAEVLAARRPPVLLVTDHLLPDTTGERLAAELRATMPGLAVLLMSGYDETEELRRRREAGELRFIQKPVGVETLAAELRAALRSAG